VSQRRRSKDPADPQSARLRALRWLARREHSAAELKRKLAHRGVAEHAAAEAVESLSRSGWQSDARYVESFVRMRVGQAYGPLRIRAELETAGVAQTLIDSALAGIDWKALASAAHAKRFGGAPQSAAQWQKQYRYLASRGFEPEQIYAVLKPAADFDAAP
jgi:regulatory protein